MNLLDPRTTGFLTHFMRAYPWRSALMVFLLALAGFLEGVGVVTMLPVLELVAGGAEDPSGVSIHVARGLEAVGLSPSLGVLLALIVFAMVAKAGFLWLAMRQVGYTVAQVTTDLRMRLLRALMRARWSYFVSQPAGRFANAISNESHRAASAYREGCVVIAGILQILAYLAVAVVVSWRMALGTLVVGSVFLVLLRGLVRMARAAGQDQTDLMRSLIARLTDALQGIKPIRAMGRERHLQPLLERETEGLNQALRRQVSATETLRLFQEPTLAILLAGGLYLALTLGNQPFPSVFMLAFIFYRVMTHVNALQTKYQVMTVGESAFWSLIEQAETAEAEHEELQGTTKVPSLREGIRFENVDFRYGRFPVLDGVSLDIPADAFVALHGPSGSGKTTIADLIVGLNRAQGGCIRVDGIPIEELDLIQWRREIGYVPQEIFLFHDTIFRNVTLGDASLTRDDVERALREAGAWSFVVEREGGMDAIIGEAGSRLSGGQRQRISIARALVHRPRLLILDEATASLDPATESAILQTLAKLQGRIAVVAISHQPGIREVAERVYHVDGGGVTQVAGSGGDRRPVST